MDDTKIIALYWERNPQAIEETDLKYGKLCHQVARNLLAHIQDAEECVNDTYQSAWTHIPPTKPAVFRAWLLKLCRNISINRFKYEHASKRSTTTDNLLIELSDCLPALNDVQAQIEEQELTTHLNNWLSNLPTADRVLFVRRYWYGDALSVLAKARGQSPKQLSSHLFRLRQKLQRHLIEQGVSI